MSAPEPRRRLKEKQRLINPYGPEGFFGKGKFHVLEAPEKSKNDMEVLRPVLSTSRRGAFNAVEKKQFLKKYWVTFFG